MELYETLEFTAVWPVGDGLPGTTLSRRPAALNRCRQEMAAIALTIRPYALLAAVAWGAVRVVLALIPYSALAWMFIAH